MFVFTGVLHIVLLQILQHIKLLQEEADKERERRLLKEKGRWAALGCTSLQIQNTDARSLTILSYRTRKEKRSEAEGERGSREGRTEKEKGSGEGEEEAGIRSTDGCSGCTGTTEEEEGREEKESQPKSRWATDHLCEKVESTMCDAVGDEGCFTVKEAYQSQ